MRAKSDDVYKRGKREAREKGKRERVELCRWRKNIGGDRYLKRGLGRSNLRRINSWDPEIFEEELVDRKKLREEISTEILKID